MPRLADAVTHGEYDARQYALNNKLARQKRGRQGGADKRQTQDHAYGGKRSSYALVNLHFLACPKTSCGVPEAYDRGSVRRKAAKSLYAE
jgi:hypothetical protein